MHSNVREVFRLFCIKTHTDLAGKKSSIASILQNLYRNDAEKVEAHVEALIEEKESELDAIELIFTKSFKNHF